MGKKNRSDEHYKPIKGYDPAAMTPELQQVLRNIQTATGSIPAGASLEQVKRNKPAITPDLQKVVHNIGDVTAQIPEAGRIPDHETTYKEDRANDVRDRANEIPYRLPRYYQREDKPQEKPVYYGGQTGDLELALEKFKKTYDGKKAAGPPVYGEHGYDPLHPERDEAWYKAHDQNPYNPGDGQVTFPPPKKPPSTGRGPSPPVKPPVKPPGTIGDTPTPPPGRYDPTPAPPPKGGPPTDSPGDTPPEKPAPPKPRFPGDNPNLEPPNPVPTLPPVKIPEEPDNSKALVPHTGETGETDNSKALVTTTATSTTTSTTTAPPAEVSLTNAVAPNSDAQAEKPKPTPYPSSYVSSDQTGLLGIKRKGSDSRFSKPYSYPSSFKTTAYGDRQSHRGQRKSRRL